MGDVSLDVARMLANTDKRLKKTDVDPEFDEFRKTRKIKNVIFFQNIFQKNLLKEKN